LYDEIPVHIVPDKRVLHWYVVLVIYSGLLTYLTHHLLCRVVTNDTTCKQRFQSADGNISKLSSAAAFRPLGEYGRLQQFVAKWLQNIPHHNSNVSLQYRVKY